MTTNPDGKAVYVHRRLAEIHGRYGSGHVVSRSIRCATPIILEAVATVGATMTFCENGPQLRANDGADFSTLSIPVLGAYSPSSNRPFSISRLRTSWSRLI
jgi:hypothetical protein